MRVYLPLIVITTLVLGLVLFVFSDKEQEQPSEGVQAYQLHNGMRLLVLENRRAPVVVSQIWYKVGGSYEYDGITGISHVLEHMMFKGTDNLPAGEFSEIIAAKGGRENAFTGKDYTAYFQRIASDQLELCLELEADRMQNLLLNEEEFIKEIEVIKEERRLRTDDKPTSLTYERFNAVAYTNSPYQQPIIGWMEDLETMDIESVRDWYKAWYAPNNATLVVAGDVLASDVFDLTKKYFGSIKPSEIPKIKPRREAEQYGKQNVVVKVPAQVPYLIMGYKVPVLKTAEEKWQAYALEVLSGLLDGGDSARLTKNLVRGSELATSVGAGYDLNAMRSSVFTLSAIPSKNVSVKKIEQALISEIQAIQNKAPSQKELNRVIAQVVASSVYEQDSTFYQAMKLGTLETVGLGWQTQEEYVDQVRAVTAEQVQEVARKYFIEKNLTVAILDPLPMSQKKTRKSKVQSGGRHGG